MQSRQPLPKLPPTRGGGIILLTAVTVGLVALFALGIWRHSAAALAAGAGVGDLPVVAVIKATPGKGKADVTLPASILAFQEATLYARTTGYVKRWLVDIGDEVKAGQLLAELEAPDIDRQIDEARAQVEQIRAQLELARTTSDRYRSLALQEAVSAQEVDEHAGALQSRTADLAALTAHQRQLEQQRVFLKVMAPFAGTITARNVELGTLVSGASASSPWLFKLAQSKTLRVMVSVPQSHVALVKAGVKGEVIVRELGDAALAAEVTRRAGAFDPATRTMTVQLDMPNPDGRVLPGMYAQVKFHLTQAAPAVTVPVNAVLIGGDGIRVATVGPDDVVHIRKVKLGRDFGKEVEIVDGVANGDRVVNNPRDDLHDGTKVKAVLVERHEKKDEKKEEKKAEAKPAPPVALPVGGGKS